jgi:hypothetical protein
VVEARITRHLTFGAYLGALDEMLVVSIGLLNLCLDPVLGSEPNNAKDDCYHSCVRHLKSPL